MRKTRLAVLTMAMVACAHSHAQIAATHIYHNHMPNFWPYYDVEQYQNLNVGDPIRYTYDGQVIELKNNPPPGYTFYIPGSGQPMPHDDLVAYYSHHAKTGAYLSWPMDTARNNNGAHPLSQTHVTMSASVINNVQSFAELGNLSGYNLGWGNYWRETQQGTKTTNGYNALDTIHFSGHHTMGPLVGNDYFLKDLIYQNATLAQDYFLGDSFRSSKGFFPTELGFSDRIIPVLNKLGIEWSVLGNVHYSRTLRDYPYLNQPGVDTMISPPNRADLRNTSDIGEWVSIPMFNEQQVTQNKFPFASIPHWVQYVDPDSGEAFRVAGIPVEQASSWEEGYQGSVSADVLKSFVGDADSLGRRQYFVIAHDGDNSSGRAGDGGTWANSGNVTYADGAVTGMGVEEYLRAYPIPDDDVVHVQDGSWIDTRDSSADPTWYHWHIPMGVWAGQMSDFNSAHASDYVATRQHMVSLELGYHYLERNFALLQAAENYAKTAEQIWLDDNPNHWQPTTQMDHEITYPGNQLNPWMMSYPVKGDANNNYAGGANPAELGWYFLIAAIDSGFGYYDENVDDGVKPTISFNQSLYFSEPYVEQNKGKDRTGPSVWWPQRYPYNPGSANKSKAEGWAEIYADTTFAIYTYAFDASGISDIQVKIRPHTNKWADATDKTYKLYDPAAHASDPNVDPSRVGEWSSFPLTERDLTPDINGVSWQAASTETFEVVPADKIGNMYYAYFDQYQEQLLDYYIEATDAKGNVTRSAIQQVYVGAGRYRNEGGLTVEDVNGNIEGEYVFFTADYTGNRKPSAVITPGSQAVERGAVVTLSGAESSDVDGEIVSYQWSTGETSQSISITVDERTSVTLTVTDDQGATSSSTITLSIIGEAILSTLYYEDTQGWGKVCLHYSTDGAQTWTTAPGVQMEAAGSGWFRYTVELEQGQPLEFVTNNCSGSWDNNGGQNYQVDEGDWQLSAGGVATGIPDELGNQAPNAVISPPGQSAAVGTVFNLSAAQSSDSDGEIVSYLWSTGETSQSISFTLQQDITISLTVTDNEGASHSVSELYQVAVNQAPVAAIEASATAVTAGTTVTLSAASSYDPEGEALSYLWSTGETRESISVVVERDMSVSVTVSDVEGLSAQAQIELKVVSEELVSNFEQLYFRGTPNGWSADAMSLVADNTWQLVVDFDGQSQQRFKFDVNGDWSLNYGDNNADGVLEQTGGDIFTAVTGSYLVEVNDQAMTYQLSPVSGDQKPSAVIDVSSTRVAVGSVVSFNAASSSDAEGDIVAYQWSTGASSVLLDLTFDQVGLFDISLTVTDEAGQTDTATVSIEVFDPNANLQSNFEQLYFRGTPNGWASSAMNLVGDNTWQLVVSFDGSIEQRFKFDVHGDWSYNFGDNNSDGVLEQTGGDIYTSVVGDYIVEVNDQSMSYRIVAAN
ncbi:PKD domain-containing protein [Aliagarivorans taiwanensis]|uniref:PKD domain-containing protein n=1 Tax=Aliagarivorans taiwanensis TaxID=561966 RepID=UPI0005580863|nr:PKD domain-containing protein [Aliagarivorans taiwanensis]